MRMYVEVSSRNTRSVFLVDHCRQNYDTSGNNVCGHRSSFRTMTLRETFLKFYTTIPCDLHKAMSDQVRNINNGQGCNTSNGQQPRSTIRMMLYPAIGAMPPMAKQVINPTRHWRQVAQRSQQMTFVTVKCNNCQCTVYNYIWYILGGGFTLHPTLLPQVQLGPGNPRQIAWRTLFARACFRCNFQHEKNPCWAGSEGILGPTWGHFGGDFRGSTGFEYDVMWFSSSDATANGRRPRGPVNIGSKCTCDARVLLRRGLHNWLSYLRMSSFFEPLVASRWQTSFKKALETDFFSKYRFSDLNLGANMGQKT